MPCPWQDGSIGSVYRQIITVIEYKNESNNRFYKKIVVCDPDGGIIHRPVGYDSCIIVWKASIELANVPLTLASFLTLATI